MSGTVVDEVQPAPKAGALPTALHPVILLFYPAGRILPNHPRYQLRYTRIVPFRLAEYPKALKRQGLRKTGRGILNFS